jgi:hypothetical protein
MHSRSPHTRPGGFIAQHASPEDSERSHRRIIRRVWAGFVIVAIGLAVMVWSADVISFEDERLNARAAPGPRAAAPGA